MCAKYPAKSLRVRAKIPTPASKLPAHASYAMK